MTEIEESIENRTQKHSKALFCNCIVDDRLYENLDNHLTAIKALKGKVTKQSWINQAIKEKLHKESSSFKVSKLKTINFKIDQESLPGIETRVNFIKKFRRTYSRKLWIVEAIQEKLEKEAKSVQEEMEKIKSSIEALSRQ